MAETGPRVALSRDSAATIKKLTDRLRKMGDKRPTKPASLWRSLKSFLGVDATSEAVEVALARLIEEGVFQKEDIACATGIQKGFASGANRWLTAGRAEQGLGCFHADIARALAAPATAKDRLSRA